MTMGLKRFENERSDSVSTRLKWWKRFYTRVGEANVFSKGPEGKYLGLCWPYSPCTQLCHYSVRAATDNVQMEEHSNKV